jgi:hypothetical protein
VVVRFRLKVEELIGCGWREDVEASEIVVRGSRTGSITTSKTIQRFDYFSLRTNNLREGGCNN